MWGEREVGVEAQFTTLAERYGIKRGRDEMVRAYCNDAPRQIAPSASGDNAAQQAMGRVAMELKSKRMEPPPHTPFLHIE